MKPETAKFLDDKFDELFAEMEREDMRYELKEDGMLLDKGDNIDEIIKFAVEYLRQMHLGTLLVLVDNEDHDQHALSLELSTTRVIK